MPSPRPRSSEETLAAAGRMRTKAAQIRGLLADPGAGCEDFQRTGGKQASFYEAVAAELETLEAPAHN